MKTLIITFISCAFVLYGKANSFQKNDTLAVMHGSRLLYYVENYSTGNNQFLIPFIETELKTMADKRKEYNGTLFSEVQSLNLFLSGNKTNKAYNAAITIFNKDRILYKTSKDLIEDNRLIAESLQNKDFFLKININILNNLLEYQFVLFEIGRSKGDKSYIKRQAYRTTSVFVNPTELDYKEKIKMNLHQLFTEANEPPVPYVTYRNKIVTDTIYVEAGKPFELVAEANDVDSAPSQLTYSWEVLNAEQKVVPLDNINSKKQVFNFGWGTYYLHLFVNDGITERDKWHIAVARYPSRIAILYPKKVGYFDSNNNSYHYYSYSRNFDPNDFKALFNLKDNSFFETSADESFAHKEILIPEIRLWTSVPTKTQLTFLTVKFNKVDEDSITNYKERVIPFFDTNTNVRQTFETTPFRIEPINIEIENKDPKYVPYYTHTYKLLIEEQDNRIHVPDIRKYKVIANAHQSISTESFQIQFHKISRVSVHFNETYYVALTRVIRAYPSLISVGLGIEYQFLPEFSIETSAGLLNPITSDTVYYNGHASRPYFYKLKANAAVINFNDGPRCFFSISALYREAFTYYNNKRIEFKDYHWRTGIGLSVLIPNSNTFNYEPVNAEIFTSFYPKTDYFTSHAIELGIRAKLNFIKKH